MLSRILPVALILLCTGCASYQTPGGPVRLGDLDHSDIAGAATTQKPSPHFPARIALVRLQAAQYRSYSASGYGEGRFSVLSAAELPTPAQLQAMSKWPSVAEVVPLDPQRLPEQLKSLGDLRLAAAKLGADILLVYTIDTSFQQHGRAYDPLAKIPLKPIADNDAGITANASAVFTDVRTGFAYGGVDAGAKIGDLAAAWSSADALDRKRLEAEAQAFAALLLQAQQTWAGIAEQYQ